jgi:hypothetical protein
MPGRHAADKPPAATADTRPWLVDARRLARFKAARERIRRIVDGSPPLTDEQRHQLALLLTGGEPPHPPDPAGPETGARTRQLG